MGRDAWTLGAGVAALLGLAMAGGAATGGSASARAPTTPRRHPSRIVSITLPTDEVLLALVPPARIVAVTHFADDPAVSNVTGPARAVRRRVAGEAEAILALRPDLVLTGAFVRPDTGALLARTHVPVVGTKAPASLDDVRAAIRTVGRAVDQSLAAEGLVAQMDATLDAVRRHVLGASRPRVLLLNEGGFTAGSDTVFDDLVRVAGGRNAAAEAGIRHHQVLPLEQALALDTDVIFTTHYRADARTRTVVPEPSLARDPAWRNARAVREGRVYHLPERHVLSTSQHVAQAAVDIARILHADRFRHAEATP